MNFEEWYKKEVYGTGIFNDIGLYEMLKTAWTKGASSKIIDDEVLSKEIMMLKVERFLVCGSGEDIAIPEPAYSIEAAIKLRDEKQAGDEYETWKIVAEIVA